MIDREKLKAYCEGFGVLLSPEQLDQFDGYCRLLLEWNKKNESDRDPGTGGGFD